MINSNFPIIKYFKILS